MENYGARTPLINDGFDDPASGWGVGTNEGGSVAYGDGELDINVKAGNAWEWTRRLTGSTSNAVHVETEYTPTGSGKLGLLCASSDDELWGAMADAQGHYSFIKVDSGGANVLSEGQLDSLKKPDNAFARFALDCKGTAAPAGVFKMQLSAPGTNEGVQFAPTDSGPASFDRVGIYVESADVAYAVAVDALLAFGGTGDTSMSPEAVELMTHIPDDWRPNCFEAFATVFETGSKADILCQLSGGKSDYAEYTWFDNKADMDAAFQHFVDQWGLPDQGQTCDTGADQGTYSVGGQSAGQILCAPSETGTQLLWTYDTFLILSQLIDLEGSYPDMYADWLIAGPN